MTSNVPKIVMSPFDAVDGSPQSLQSMLQLLNQEESNGTGHDSWIGYREVGFSSSWH
jgi:hypothetical protein